MIIQCNIYKIFNFDIISFNIMAILNSFQFLDMKKNACYRNSKSINCRYEKININSTDLLSLSDTISSTSSSYFDAFFCDINIILSIVTKFSKLK